MSGPTVAGESAAHRLMLSVQRRSAWTLSPTLTPTERQTAAVLHALADHTALLAALDYDPPDGNVQNPGNAATSLGRWLHAVADNLEGDHR